MLKFTIFLYFGDSIYILLKYNINTMPQVTSIQGNSIRYDESTLEKSIQAVLLERIDASELEEKWIADLYDPYLLTGMHEAVDRIKQAKEQGEKIMIFGDYDVDGVTSTSILMHFFKTVGMSASYRLPHRVHDGYGLKKYFIDEIADLGVGLIITVDCGTRDIEVIQYAKSKGVDVIVTDHHAVPEIIPEEAVAIINPKREDCNYPSKNLAGAGVAFKLMSALAKEMLPADKYLEYIGESIDIAAIGTVADCMSLIGENRIIVTEGLKQLKRTRSRGIRALIEDKIHEDLDSDVFGFIIGPRLNAAGRMDTPYKAVNLILNNSETLEETLRDIEMLNEKRKMMTKQFVEQALESVNREDNILFYESAEIEHGIIGIVAGRLTEQFYRPAIVLIDDGEKLVASCRSPEFFSIVELLEKHRDFFVAFWGHKQAAGFTIKKSKFAEFKQKVLDEVNAIDFSMHQKEIQVDKLVKLEELGFGFLHQMNAFKPFGLGNTKPVLMVQDLEYTKFSFLGQGRDHIRFDTVHGFKIFGFNMGRYYDEIKQAKKIDLIFDVSEDSWQGRRNLMLKVVDVIVWD